MKEDRLTEERQELQNLLSKFVRVSALPKDLKVSQIQKEISELLEILKEEEKLSRQLKK